MGRVIHPLRPDRVPYWAEERADGCRPGAPLLAAVFWTCVGGVGLAMLIASLI